MNAEERPQRHGGSDPAPGEPRTASDLDSAWDATSAAWVRRLKNNPDSSTIWVNLSDRYRHRILVYTAHRLGPQLRRICDPEDIVNEAWMQIYSKLDQFDYRHRGSLYGWLCQQVRRVILTKSRAIDRKGPLPRLQADMPPERGLPDQEDVQRGPATEALDRDLMDLLLDSLEKVPVIYRQVLVATHLENMNRTEVAAALGLKPNTVSQQLKRGMELWRRAFGGDPLEHI